MRYINLSSKIKFDITHYDTPLYTLRGTDDVFQALEDNQVKLQTMKASRFVKAFEADVDHWERTLSLISEVVEMLLTVQRQWMYLEVRQCYDNLYSLCSF